VYLAEIDPAAVKPGDTNACRSAECVGSQLRLPPEGYLLDTTILGRYKYPIDLQACAAAS